MLNSPILLCQEAVLKNQERRSLKINRNNKKKKQRYPTKWRKQVPTSCWALGSGCKHSSTTFRNSLWTARISSILENNICKIKTEIKTVKSVCEASLKISIKKPRRTQHLKQIATSLPGFLLLSKQKTVSSGLLFSHRTLGMGTPSWNSGKSLRDKACLRHPLPWMPVSKSVGRFARRLSGKSSTLGKVAQNGPAFLLARVYV